MVARLLPNGEQQFLDVNGAPLGAGTVGMYIPNTLTPKNTWSDVNATILNTNPIVLDAGGRAIIFGIGQYRQQVKDVNNNIIWDQITEGIVDTMSAGGTSTGSANAQVVAQGTFASQNGQMINFIAGFSNTGAITLAVGTGAPLPLLKNSPSGPVACVSGDIIAGNNYIVSYDLANARFILAQSVPSTLSVISLSNSGNTILTGIISPATLATGLNNDYTPAGLATATVVRLSGNATPVSTLTGIAAQAAGTVLLLENVGAYPIFFLGQSGSSLAANRFLNTAPFTLFGGQSVLVQYDAANAGWQILASITASPPSATRRNLKIVTTSITAATITADELILRDVNGLAYRVGNVNVAYSTSATGANGLDTGVMAASTWYNEFVIYNPTAATAAALISLSATTPTLPAGYTFFARVGASYFDAASKLRFKVQYDRKAQIVIGTNPTALPIMTSGSLGNPTTPTWVAVAVGAFVPPTASIIRGVMVNAQNDSTRGILAPNNTYGIWSSTTNPPPIANGNNGITGSFIIVNTPFEFTLESTNIYYASSNGSSLVLCLGWEDNL